MLIQEKFKATFLTINKINKISYISFLGNAHFEQVY